VQLKRFTSRLVFDVRLFSNGQKSLFSIRVLGQKMAATLLMLLLLLPYVTQAALN
jgi:hypothetical protein